MQIKQIYKEKIFKIVPLMSLFKLKTYDSPFSESDPLLVFFSPIWGKKICQILKKILLNKTKFNLS